MGSGGQRRSGGPQETKTGFRKTRPWVACVAEDDVEPRLNSRITRAPPLKLSTALEIMVHIYLAACAPRLRELGRAHRGEPAPRALPNALLVVRVPEDAMGLGPQEGLRGTRTGALRHGTRGAVARARSRLTLMSGGALEDARCLFCLDGGNAADPLMWGWRVPRLVRVVARAVPG